MSGLESRWRRVRFPQWLRNTNAGMLIEAFLAYAPTTRGRARRGELFASVVILVGASVFLGALSNIYQDGLTVLSNLLLTALILLPLFSQLLRRLHDTGRNGWALFTLLAPYIGVFIVGYALLRPSQPFETRYGPDPHQK